MKKAALFLALVLLLSSVCPAFAAKKKKNAEPVVTAEPIPEPTANPDAAPYDPEHPDDLTPDQLWAASAVLMTQDKGEVIFEKDPDTIRPPASMTKILTVLLGIMFADDLEEKVTVSETAVNVPADSSTMHLKVGEEIRFIDVLYGTMLISANDGANVIAEVISGDIQRFVNLMNETAASFGCTNTHFMNPHGYHADGHYSTARDIAIISREAMKNEIFREIARTVSYQIPRTNMQRTRTLTTKSDYMLTGDAESPNKYYYEYATGIKTGSHSQSGWCFAGAASKDGVDLVSVVMFTGKRNRWNDTIKLMNYGFSQYMSVTPADLYNMNPITIETSNYSTSDPNRGKVKLLCKPLEGSATIVTTKSEVRRMADNLTNLVLIHYDRDFQAPMEAGEQIGTMTYFPERGDPVVYALTAGRTVEQRTNIPKTLEQIVAETYADPNPFPPFNFEFALTLFGPVILLAVLFLLLRAAAKRRRAHRMRAPKPGHRYVK